MRIGCSNQSIKSRAPIFRKAPEDCRATSTMAAVGDCLIETHSSLERQFFFLWYVALRQKLISPLLWCRDRESAKIQPIMQTLWPWLYSAWHPYIIKRASDLAKQNVFIQSCQHSEYFAWLQESWSISRPHSHLASFRVNLTVRTTSILTWG